MSRVISGLQWARACEKPACIPNSRARGRKAAGLRYERELAKAIPEAIHGQWFEFQDAKGRGWCQPDLFLHTASAVFVLESKYTWTEAGHKQIDGLYRPVLEGFFHAPVLGIVVCKVLTPAVNRAWVCRSLSEAMLQAAAGRKTVLHWIGAGLEPFRREAATGHLATPHLSL